MGLLGSLGLPELATLPPRAGKTVSGPTVNAPGAPARKPVAPVVDETNAFSPNAGPIVDEDNVAVPVRARTLAKTEPGEAAALEPAPPAGRTEVAEATGAAQTAHPPPTTEEVGFGDLSLGLKESADGASVIVKYERKQTVAAQNFKVWVIPCYVKADLKVGIEGEIVIKGEGDRQVNIKSGGALELGIGGTSDAVTAGPYGEVALSASSKIPTRLSEARKIAMNPFVIDIYGTGKVGIKFELKDSWTRNAECELANWHLFVVHVGPCQNGVFASFRVEPGKDMQRLFAALQQVGPAIADAVEKYAPDAVKKAAEDGAKWVAESEDAKEIADTTGKVLDTVKDQTGVDVGAGAEKVVQFLVDPEGETSSEANARFTKEAEAANEAHADFRSAMQASGLDGELRSRTKEETAEYNAIVDTKDAGGDWKSMIPTLVAKRKTRRFEQAKAEAARRKKAQGDADAAAVADLARRVQASEAAMNAALTAANMLGNPLNNRTQGQSGSKARKYWETGMNQFWSPGSAARLQCASLQGEAKIAKAQQATALLVKARAVFQEGMRMIQ
ncbi:MAG: hypothetical protein ABIQ06_09770 [Caldimonas sp.]